VRNRQSRSGSVAVVCPEAADQGKPKLFARQSFVVTGDDQMMAETILEARKLGKQGGWRCCASYALQM
jgi:hypothetical protein